MDGGHSIAGSLNHPQLTPSSARCLPMLLKIKSQKVNNNSIVIWNFFVPQERANYTSFLLCLCLLSSDSEATVVFLTTFSQNAGCLPALTRHWEQMRQRFWLGGRLSTWFGIAIKWCAHSGKHMHLLPGLCRKTRPAVLIAAVLKIVNIISFQNAYSCHREVSSFQTLVWWLQNYNMNTSPNSVAANKCCQCTLKLSVEQF